MNFNDWYTDLFTIERNVDVIDGSLTRKELIVIAEGVKGRVYRRGSSLPRWQQTAADANQNLKLACDNSVDIKAGDRLTITLGGVLGYSKTIYVARAGDPDPYYEPFGAVMPQLAHQQVDLEDLKRI